MSSHVDDGILVLKRGDIDDVISKLKEYCVMKETSELHVCISQKCLGRIITCVEKYFEVRCTEDLMLPMAEVLGLGGASGLATPGVKAEA